MGGLPRSGAGREGAGRDSEVTPRAGAGGREGGAGGGDGRPQFTDVITTWACSGRQGCGNYRNDGAPPAHGVCASGSSRGTAEC